MYRPYLWGAVAGLVVASLGASPAHADSIDLQLRGAVMLGKERPALILSFNRDIRAGTVDLKDDDGRSQRHNLGKQRAGSSKELVLEAPVGLHTLTGQLQVTYTDGTTASMPLSLPVEVVKSFDLVVPHEKVDLAAGTLEVQLSRRAGHCDTEVLIDGRPPRQDRTDFHGEPPGTWLQVQWSAAAEGALTLRIAMTCHDDQDVFETGIELYPWKLEIPHQDVVFDTAKWDIRPAEQPKIDEAHQEIAAAVAKYGRWIEGVKLFVGGHTDTVGDAASNEQLSLRRAKAIAQAFRRLGVKVPIYYAGFGERRLAVDTADEIDSQANRRADYTIRVTMPDDVAWQKL